MRTKYFRPSMHGWPFGNSWRKSFTWDIVTLNMGFCGGICWRALQRFCNAIPIARDTPVPARLFVLITAIVFACTSALAQENPAVERIPREAHPGIPAGLKLVCHQRPQRPQPTTWPVLKWRGVSYWAYSFIDNRDAMAIVAYNARGEVLRRWDRTGARYLETILVKHGTREVLFLGQGNQYIKMRWDELDLEAAEGK